MFSTDGRSAVNQPSCILTFYFGIFTASAAPCSP